MFYHISNFALKSPCSIKFQEMLDRLLVLAHLFTSQDTSSMAQETAQEIYRVVEFESCHLFYV